MQMNAPLKTVSEHSLLCRRHSEDGASTHPIPIFAYVRHGVGFAAFLIVLYLPCSILFGMKKYEYVLLFVM